MKGSLREDLPAAAAAGFLRPFRIIGERMAEEGPLSLCANCQKMDGNHKMLFQSGDSVL